MANEEVMGGLVPSINWWPGNRGAARLQQCREKDRSSSGRDDSRGRPAPTVNEGETMRETTKYKCLSCGWHGDTLGDRPTDDGDVECCPMCDSDDIAVTPNG